MYTIGIDLGGTNIAAGLVDQKYKIIRKTSRPTGAERTADDIVKDMAAVCQKLCEEEGITCEQISSVGIATPGTADTDNGMVVYANNLPFRNFPPLPITNAILTIKSNFGYGGADCLRADDIIEPHQQSGKKNQ